MTVRARAAAAAMLALAFAPALALAQDAQRAALLTVTVSPESVTVGQPFSVRIRVRAPKSATIRFPAVPDTADAVEAVDPRATEDAGDAELIDRTAVYRLVAWDVGRRTPHFAPVSVGTGGAEKQYPVFVPAVTVLTMLPADSTQRTPKDARDPVEPPGIWWKVALLGGIALAGLVWWWRRRRALRALAPARQPEPFAAAEASFEALEALGLPAAGEPGRHVIASVDVLRGYLSRRFPDMRDSLTAQEIERGLPGSELPVLPQRLASLLDRESAVRFARADLTADEAVALAQESQAIVRDVELAYVERLRALERRPQQGRRR